MFDEAVWSSLRAECAPREKHGVPDKLKNAFLALEKRSGISNESLARRVIQKKEAERWRDNEEG